MWGTVTYIDGWQCSQYCLVLMLYARGDARNYFRRPFAFNCLHLSLWILWIITLHCLVIGIKLGWSEGIRRSDARFKLEQSSMNCVRTIGEQHVSILCSGKNIATVLSNSGVYLPLVSAVALHWVKMWGMFSLGVTEGLLSPWHNLQLGSVPLSMARYSKHW